MSQSVGIPVIRFAFGNRRWTVRQSTPAERPVSLRRNNRNMGIACLAASTAGTPDILVERQRRGEEIGQRGEVEVHLGVHDSVGAG